MLAKVQPCKLVAMLIEKKALYAIIMKLNEFMAVKCLVDFKLKISLKT